jgi:hypothetical protein
VLIALALALVVLAMLSLAAPLLARARLGVRLVYAASACISLVFAAGGIAGLVGAAEAMALPFGPPWGAMRLALDPLSAWFLLILGLCGLAASAFAFGHVKGPEAPRRLVPYPLFLAGMGLTLLAADGFTLVLGFELMSFASWVLVAHEHEQAENRRAARLYLGFAALGGAGGADPVLWLACGGRIRRGGFRCPARGAAGWVACLGDLVVGGDWRGVQGRAGAFACLAALGASGGTEPCERADVSRHDQGGALCAGARGV